MKTASGFEFEFDEKRLKNMELLDAFRKLQNADSDDSAGDLSDLITLLMGPKEKKRLYDHIRDEDGLVPPEAFAIEAMEIFTHLNDNAAVKK